MISAPVRFLPRAEELERMPAAAVRESFLIEDLFEDGALRLVLADMDRMAVGGAMPRDPMPLPPVAEFGTRYFTERREAGIFNLGPPGVVRVGSEEFGLGTLDCLYVGMEEPDVVLGPGTWYFLSCPAHAKYPTARMRAGEAASSQIGDSASASKRCLHRFIHPGGLRSCQLVMGFTELALGSVWNTMPPHTHSRRSEVYLYFDLADGMVVHLMGRPESTRHLIVREREAVLSPSWSMHAGAGTRNYKFIWGMAGENQSFEDMDPAPLSTLR